MISTDNIVRGFDLCYAFVSACLLLCLLAVAFKIVLWYNVRNKNESVSGCRGIEAVFGGYIT